MRRSTPLRRTGFKRPERAPRVTPVARPLERAPNYGDPANQPVYAMPKEAPARSERYRRLAALLPCMACGVAGYSQAAHPNTGKGMGMKADDRLCFPLCADRVGVRGCHSLFDQGALFVKAERRSREVEWGAATRRRILGLGLWPDNLPMLEE